MEQVYGPNVITLPLSWLTWLAASPIRLALYGHREALGVVRFLHLLAMAVFFGAVLLLELRRLGMLPAEIFAQGRAEIGRIVSAGFWATVVSGVVLFLYNPLGNGLHSMFLPKLVLVAVGYALAKAKRLAPRRVLALASLAVWVAVVGASTWNHVERPARPAAAARAGTYGAP